MWRGALKSYQGTNERVLPTHLDVFDGNTEEWTKLNTQGMDSKCFYGSAFTISGEKGFLFGGFDGRTFTNSLHELNTKTLKWTELSTNIEDGPMKKAYRGITTLRNGDLCIFAGRALRGREQPGSYFIPYKDGRGDTNELHCYSIESSESAVCVVGWG